MKGIKVTSTHSSPLDSGVNIAAVASGSSKSPSKDNSPENIAEDEEKKRRQSIASSGILSLKELDEIKTREITPLVEVSNKDGVKIFQRSDHNDAANPAHPTIKETNAGKGFQYEVTKSAPDDVHIVNIPMLDSSGKKSDKNETIYLDNKGKIIAHEIDGKYMDINKMEANYAAAAKDGLKSQMDMDWFAKTRVNAIDSGAMISTLKASSITEQSTGGTPLSPSPSPSKKANVSVSSTHSF